MIFEVPVLLYDPLGSRKVKELELVMFTVSANPAHKEAPRISRNL